MADASVTITLDGVDIEVDAGQRLIEAAREAGTYIPRFCYDKRMEPVGLCRTCLVEIDGVRGFPASCSVPAADGMKVSTDTPEVSEIRRGVVELTLGMFPKNGGNSDRGYKELTIAARRYEVDADRWGGREREPTDTSNPVFNIAMDSCILCSRCVQACQDGHQFIGAIDFLGSSLSSRIGTFAEKPLIESVCTTCG
ncbi:MAG: (2Fe-2S)-binding protein, partial [Acidobacteria bacterium]|nr:(2Fe-2S)-binding protein [Acidobacteriota bacterium]